MLSRRLTLGPILLALLALVSWLDQEVEALAAPGWLASITGEPTWPPGAVIFPVLAVVVVGAAIELSTLLRASGIAASPGFTGFAAFLGLFASAGAPARMESGVGAALVSSAVVVVLVVAVWSHARTRSLAGVMASTGGSLLAFSYLGVLAGFLLLIRRHETVWVLLGVLFTTKAADIGAYFTGIAIGRRRLIPWLSPGKTWEGLIGGLIFSTAVGMGASALSPRFGFSFIWWQGAIFGLALGLAGQAGDLVASMLKRDAGVKDSSRALPGFGGVLDVLDSPLLAAPVAYWLLRFMMS